MLEHKVALVTGGTRGIGLGCVQSLVNQGWLVAICSLGDDASKQEANAALEQLSQQGQQGDSDLKAAWFACDMRVEEDVKSLIRQVIDMYGQLDCMVNNVGWHPPAGQIDEVASGAFESLLQLNLTSTFYGCKYALPHLRKRKGSIVNISSKVGQIGQASAVGYVTTKAGQIGMTKALALDEAGQGVRVNAICPAGVDTPMMQQWAATLDDPASALAKEDANHALGKMATIEEVGDVCAFLASDAARFVTGQAIGVDGGAGLGYQRWD